MGLFLFSLEKRRLREEPDGGIIIGGIDRSDNEKFLPIMETFKSKWFRVQSKRLKGVFCPNISFAATSGKDEVEGSRNI